MEEISKLSLNDGKKSAEEKSIPTYGKVPLFEKKPRNTEGTPVVIETNIRRISK